MSSHVLAKNAGADALQIAKLFNVDGWVCVVTGGELLSPQASFILAVCTSFEPSLTLHSNSILSTLIRRRYRTRLDHRHRPRR